MNDYASLPGYELIVGGIDDLRNQRETIAALCWRLVRQSSVDWASNFRMIYLLIQNIVFMICYLQLILIQLIPNTTL